MGRIQSMGEQFFDCRVEREGMGSLKESATPEQIKKAGLISYWGAEFEFPTCPAFSRGVMECARRGLYAFTLQSEAYNERVGWWMEHVRGWKIEGDFIVPTHGTIFALATALRLFVRENERMIVILPGYNRYEQAARRLKRETVFSYMKEEKERYVLDFEDLERKMADPRNRLLAFCNPNNPTGTIYGEEDLKRIAALSKKYEIPVFCDEIFGEVVLEGSGPVPYGKAAGKDSLSMTCTSLGKCMSLTGVNHANVLIPNPKLRAAYIEQKYADHYGSIDPMLYAGLMKAYTQEGKAFVKELCQVIKRNAEILKQGLREALPGAAFSIPQGTYVAWVDYRGLGLEEKELSAFLNEEALFFGDPGSEYGASDEFYRYNLAVPPRELMNSMERLKEAAAKRGLTAG